MTFTFLTANVQQIFELTKRKRLKKSNGFWSSSSLFVYDFPPSKKTGKRSANPSRAGPSCLASFFILSFLLLFSFIFFLLSFLKRSFQQNRKRGLILGVKTPSICCNFIISVSSLGHCLQLPSSLPPAALIVASSCRRHLPASCPFVLNYPVLCPHKSSP